MIRHLGGLALLGSVAMGLTSCGTSHPGSTGPEKLACASINVFFSGQSPTTKEAQSLIAFSERSGDAYLESAAKALQIAANRGDQSLVNHDVGDLAERCHDLNLGPGD